MSKSALHRAFIQVLKAVKAIGPEIIRWPSPDKRRDISRGFAAYSRFPNVVGAVDGTYVPIKAPEVDGESYICRKCFHAITLQGICDDKR